MRQNYKLVSMITRKIDAFLEDFFHTDSRSALLLTGARQVGKTYSIRQFGTKNYAHFVEINFIDQPDAAAIFTKGKNGAEEILLRLSAFVNQDLVPNQTLIFFDEVQEVPEVLTAIKFLVDDGRFRYVLSGSLLGVHFQDLRSVPVGYVQIKQMYPLDLYEFCQAIGVQPTILEHLQNAFEKEIEVDPVVHEQMLNVVRTYLVVGGMPAAVDTYLNTRNIRQVVLQQQSILMLYRKDIAKYDKPNKLYIESIFDGIAPQLSAKNKRYIVSRLSSFAKFERLENSFLWLCDAGVALPTFNVEEPKSPLLLSSSRSLFKLFANDVGLLAAQYANHIQIKILSGDDHINFGAVYENLVAQELTAHNFQLFYFNSKKQGEIDFIIEHPNGCLPIEVKSGKDYERHAALNNILQNEEYNIKQAYVVCNGNVKKEGRVIYYPIYMTMFMHQSLPSMIFQPDISNII